MNRTFDELTAYRILSGDSFGYDEVDVDYRPGAIERNAAAEEWISQRWESELKRAAARGVHIYNGRLFRLDRFEVKEVRLQLVLSDTDYRDYVGTRSPDFARRFGDAWVANPLAVCIALLTRDGRIAVEQRRAVDVYAGRFHVIGGYVDRDLDGAAVHPFRAMQREVREETGLALADSGLRIVGLVYDRLTLHPELCFLGRANATFDELRELHRSSRTDGEVAQLESIDAGESALADFLRAQHGRMSPTGEACLLLSGRRVHRKEGRVKIEE